ncbi:MAG: zinc ribbon domain-containing protein [Methanobacteriota archaeon]|nr:MAG: zinc ribbon domain-containing protein [Euryarchaeota archaeon]
MVLRMNPDEGDEDFVLPQPPPPTAPPPKQEIKIVDASTKRRGKACVVCGRPKAPYIEVDVDGVVEYTCQDCYELQAQGLSGEVTAYCVTCGAALLKGDHFCGRCGTPAALRCPKCGARPEEEDAFCGKCGAALRAPA